MADKYAYRVIWSDADQEYVGLCAEFPSLSWLAESQAEALQGITQIVSDCLEDMKAEGEDIPEPLATKKFSGKFLVRILPEAHRRLAIQAAESGVSLNRVASDKLSYG